MLSCAQFLELAAIIVAGTMVGNELAVAVFSPPWMTPPTCVPPKLWR